MSNQTIATKTTVTISITSYQILEQLSSSSGKDIPTVLEQAIEQYHRQRFLEEANQAYAILRQDSLAWQEELAERELWDITLEDCSE